MGCSGSIPQARDVVRHTFAVHIYGRYICHAPSACDFVRSNTSALLCPAHRRIDQTGICGPLPPNLAAKAGSYKEESCATKPPYKPYTPKPYKSPSPAAMPTPVPSPSPVPSTPATSSPAASPASPSAQSPSPSSNTGQASGTPSTASSPTTSSSSPSTGLIAGIAAGAAGEPAAAGEDGRLQFATRSMTCCLGAAPRQTVLLN